MEINYYALMELIFPYLFASVFVWFFLIYKLIKILEVRHPETFDRLEKPKFLREQGMLPLLKYLVLLKWRSSEDTGLRNLCWFMILFLCIYFLIFLSLWFGMLFTAF